MELQTKVLVFAVVVLSLSAFYSFVGNQEDITGNFFNFNFFQDKNEQDNFPEDGIGVWPNFDGEKIGPERFEFEVYPGKINFENDDVSLYEYGVAVYTKAPYEMEWSTPENSGRIDFGAVGSNAFRSIPFQLDPDFMPYGQNEVLVKLFNDEGNVAKEERFLVYNTINKQLTPSGVTGRASSVKDSKNPPPPKVNPPVITPGDGSEVIDDEPSVTIETTKKPYCTCKNVVVWGHNKNAINPKTGEKRGLPKEIPQNVYKMHMIGDKSVKTRPVRNGLGSSIVKDSTDRYTQGTTFLGFAQVEGDASLCESSQFVKIATSYNGKTRYLKKTVSEITGTEQGGYDIEMTDNPNDPSANSWHYDDMKKQTTLYGTGAYDSNGVEKKIPDVALSNPTNDPNAPPTGISWVDWPGIRWKDGDYPKGQTITWLFKYQVKNSPNDKYGKPQTPFSSSCIKYYGIKTEYDTDVKSEFYGPDEKYNEAAVEEALGWPLR